MEARHQRRAGRKPERRMERVNEGSATSMSCARERKALLVVKGRRLVEARRSSSRERCAIDQGTAGSFAFRCGRVARRRCRPKAPRIGKAHALHRAPAEPVLAASEPRCGDRNRDSTPTSSGEATGVSETVTANAPGGRQRPRAALARPSKWGSRCEPRLSPASFSSGGPSCPMPAPRVSGRAQPGSRKKTFRVNEHEPQGSV